MKFKTHIDSKALAEWLGEHVAKLLSDAVVQNGSASIAVSGGGTPKLFFTELSKQDIDWQNVTITLVDERWVDATSDRSNAKLVNDLLLQNYAANAKFLPLFNADIKASQINDIADKYKALLPFDVVILGMGGDGHTASFFPDGNKLSDATDLNATNILIDMEAEGAGEPRVTFTLPPLINAGETILHIEGARKKQVFDEAKNKGDANALPIRHVLNNCPDLRIVWAL